MLNLLLVKSNFIFEKPPPPPPPPQKYWPLGSCWWCLLYFLLLSHVVSWVRCGTRLYRFLIFAVFLTSTNWCFHVTNWKGNLLLQMEMISCYKWKLCYKWNTSPLATELEGGILFLVPILLAWAFAWHFLACKLSRELVGWLEPNLHGYDIWAWLRLDRVLVILL